VVVGMSVEGNAETREDQAARNQALFREINERVRELNRSFAQLVDLGDWICECANDTCVERVEMSIEDYETIRRGGNSFFVVPSKEHVWPDVERVTKQTGRYWIVEAIGEAGKPAAVPSSDGPLRLKT
jgi:hypothetical protein